MGCSCLSGTAAGGQIGYIGVFQIALDDFFR